MRSEKKLCKHLYKPQAVLS